MAAVKEREAVSAVVPTKPDAEQYLSPAEIAEVWGVSAKTVQRIFRIEPGVLLLGAGQRKTMRIPQSVFERVDRLNRNPAFSAKKTK